MFVEIKGKLQILIRAPYLLYLIPEKVTRCSESTNTVLIKAMLRRVKSRD